MIPEDISGEILGDRTLGRGYILVRSKNGTPMAAVTFDLWHTLIQLSPTSEDCYVENQEIAIAEVLRDSPREAHSARGRLVNPMEAAHLAFSAAVARGGRERPLPGSCRMRQSGRAAKWTRNSGFGP